MPLKCDTGLLFKKSFRIQFHLKVFPRIWVDSVSSGNGCDVREREEPSSSWMVFAYLNLVPPTGSFINTFFSLYSTFSDVQSGHISHIGKCWNLSESVHQTERICLHSGNKNVHTITFFLKTDTRKMTFAKIIKNHVYNHRVLCQYSHTGAKIFNPSKNSHF